MRIMGGEGVPVYSAKISESGLRLFLNSESHPSPFPAAVSMYGDKLHRCPNILYNPCQGDEICRTLDTRERGNLKITAPMERMLA